MPVIELETHVKSDIRICFDLSRSIDLHQISTEGTNETAIEGKTSGLISLNEYVTWQATHFGVTQRLTSKITAFHFPSHFRDEQQKGIFKYIMHDHFFKSHENDVLMTDKFEYGAPFGIGGKVFSGLILTSYLRKFLIKRNNIIKQYAESDKWKTILNESDYM